MTTAVIRRAPENASFRLVEREDLVAGTEIFVINPDAGPYEIEHPYSKIRLDEVPVSEGGHGLYVRYHCIAAPSWDGDCFVPVDEFVGERQDPTTSRYWLPISS